MYILELLQLQVAIFAQPSGTPTPTLNETLRNLIPLLPYITLIVAAIGAFFTARNFIKSQIWSHIRAKLDERSLKKELGSSLLLEEEIQCSLRYYMKPDVQDIDPTGLEEPRAIVGVRGKLFDVFDEILSKKPENRYTILLADSGMGKSSALINYAAWHIRRWGKVIR